MESQREKSQRQIREKNTEMSILSEERQRLFVDKEKFESQAKNHKIQNRALSVTVSQMQVERNHRKTISEKLNLTVNSVESSIKIVEQNSAERLDWLQIFSGNVRSFESKGISFI